MTERARNERVPNGLWSGQPSEADVFILCVPTPIRADKTADLSYVESAARALRPFVKSGNLVLLAQATLVAGLILARIEQFCDDLSPEPTSGAG